MTLIDSDILIWSSKNNANAQLFLLQTVEKAISVVTYMELLEGFKNKQEQRAFEYYVMKSNFEVLPINEVISLHALNLVKTYHVSHSMAMEDALIASTAIFYNLPFITANQKHYRFIPNLNLLPFQV